MHSVRHLWFFSHPTVEVFERFMADADVCRSFSHYVGVLETNRSRRSAVSRINRRKKSQRKVAPNNEARLLVSRYVPLLSYVEVLFPFVGRNKKQLAVVLIPEPEYDEGSVTRLCEQIERTLLNDVVHDVLIKAQRYRQYLFMADGCQLPTHPGETDVEILRDQVVTELDIGDFNWSVPGWWMPSSALNQMFTSLVCSGSWPRYTIANKTRLEVNSAKMIHSTVDRRAVEDVFVSNHVRAVMTNLRRTHCGLLPIGLKIHCVTKNPPGVEGLQQGYFTAHNAGRCFNLPPLGNIDAVRLVFDTLQKRTGVSFLDNPDFQIQVCSPGMLSPQNAALLGIGFYLGASTIQRYRREDFITSHQSLTGTRLIIYGAGVMDASFDWWAKDKWGNLVIESMSQPGRGIYNRTDVLTCRSIRDIQNVNLIATLLLHAQYGGYWKDLGEQFIAEMRHMLERHMLMGLLDASWVRQHYTSLRGPDSSAAKDSSGFFDALEELMNYVFAEVERINRQGESGKQGILYEMQSILHLYRSEMELLSPMKGDEQ